MKKNKQGFTLIELLAVIVILGVIMAIAIPAMTGYIDDSKKDSMVSSALEYIGAATKRITANNMLPVSGASTYMRVADIEISQGGVSPYTNHAFNSTKTTGNNSPTFSDASYETLKKRESYVVVRNQNGNYTYTIYLTDGTNCLTATEKQLNGKAEEKRALIHTNECPSSIQDPTKVKPGENASNCCVVPSLAGATATK